MVCPCTRGTPPACSSITKSEEGSKAVLAPMAIVWPCATSVETYAVQGRDVEVPRPNCPSCLEPMALWSGYWRFAREEGKCIKLWVPRARCKACQATHALLPAFLLQNRLDTVNVIGAAIQAVVSLKGGIRPAARAAKVPHTTARGWIRRFFERAEAIAVSFAALSVELGGLALPEALSASQSALQAIETAFLTARSLPGWIFVGQWRFCSAVCGGSLIAANTNPPWFMVGKRRFMPPVP